MGYTAWDPKFDVPKLNKYKKEPLRSFNSERALLNENGERFKMSKVRDDLKTGIIGIAHFNNMRTARGFEGFIQRPILNGCRIIQPKSKENCTINITSAICDYDMGARGTYMPNGQVYSVFIIYEKTLLTTQILKQQGLKWNKLISMSA